MSEPMRDVRCMMVYKRRKSGGRGARERAPPPPSEQEPASTSPLFQTRIMAALPSRLRHSRATGYLRLSILTLDINNIWI